MQNPLSSFNGPTSRPPAHRSGGYQQGTTGMLTFIIGLMLGACIGVAVMGICTASYEHQRTE